MWTSHVSSFDGFHYYVIFVDHCTKYIWFYQLLHKSDVNSTFVAFKQLVENYFTTTNKTLYTDNEGEFLALRSFLATHGTTHLTTPPHTSEHNGYSERRQRYIVETGLTLMHQASIPLINRMPKVGLCLGSSFEKLFHKVTNPSKFRVFGCLCFPWLCRYFSHKLDLKSSLCVFLVYSLTCSVFLCFNPTLKTIFVSRHVKFVENLCVPFAGNKHRLYSPHFLVHLRRPFGTVELNRPLECFPTPNPTSR